MTIKEFFSFKTNKFFWLNIIAMIEIGRARLNSSHSAK